MKDEVWRGAAFRKGDMVLINYTAANIDDRVFADGDKVDIGRERINHIAFGAGPHRCIGRHLARIEINVMLQEWLARVPMFSPDPELPDKTHGGHVVGMDALPLVW
jgi:cytochrome P450